MNIQSEIEGYIKAYTEIIKDTPYFKKILSAGSKDILGNIKKYLGKSLTIKMLPMSMDKDEALNLFVNLQNVIKESENIINDTYSRDILNNKNIIFAFKIKTIPERNILLELSHEKDNIKCYSIGNKTICIINSNININVDIDYSYILLLYLISFILEEIKKKEGNKDILKFFDYKMLESFTIYAYTGLSSTDVYEIELSDISWLYKEYFKNDKNPFIFVKYILGFVKDREKDKVIVALLNKLIYLFLNYRKIDKEILDIIYNEIFKRAYNYNISVIPSPTLLIMNSNLKVIYMKGYEIGKKFKDEKEYIEKVILALKSERDPASFRDKLLNYLITGKSEEEFLLPEELFIENLPKKEFLSIKDAFLAGLWNGSHTSNDEGNTDKTES